jgi:predicted RNase H-like nuclease/ppGpp synthetase/RelA/SpoT-type nucleotidyltranferase
VHFVGIDLAWGDRRPTGLAVLTGKGQLAHLSAATTDESIITALTPYTSGKCLVAIDAPLVVTNPSGNRPAERALNRDFAKYDAGAHPSNTAKPEFSVTPRGARLAVALGLDIDPDSTARRRAIEVYPHPATVSLFRLGRTLKYKQKPGRPLPQLKAELLRLMRLLEGLADASPAIRVGESEAWRALVVQVQNAQRKADLRRAEDQVDAVVCAYVALYADRRPDRMTTYGDLAEGYIVTPTLPPDHVPEPRGRLSEPITEPTPEATTEPTAAPITKDPVASAVRVYAAKQPELVDVTDDFVAMVTGLLDDAGINYLSVTGRAKTVASFAGKASRRRADGRPLYADPLTEITDAVGVRIILYLQSDVAAVADLLGDQLVVLHDRDLGQETADEGRFGYASRHLLVSFDEARQPPAAYSTLDGHAASVQVRTVLQHAWAEFEHDIRYKGSIPEEHARDLDRRFTLAAGLLELADREFSAIRERIQESMTEQLLPSDAADPRISAQDLATFLAGRYADAGWSRTDHYAWISGLLLELGISSLDELADLLGSVDTAAIHARMGYRQPTRAVRRLDDALLAVFGERYLGLHGNAHRLPLLTARLAKLTATPAE